MANGLMPRKAPRPAPMSPPRRMQEPGEAMSDAVKGTGPVSPAPPRLGPTGPRQPEGMPPTGTEGTPPGGAPPAPGTGVAGRLGTLLDTDSPYLQRARTRAKQYANRRGLMNSSIAAGAGEAAAIDAALPIATADANIGLQDRMQRRNIRSQQLMQERGLTHDEAQREADRELQTTLQEKRSEDEAAAREASQRVTAQQVVTRINADYQRSLDSIRNNPNIPAPERAEAIKRITVQRDESLSLVQQLGQIQMRWTTYAEANPPPVEEAA